jgi:periplasmic divalent cation tolerance protein
MLSIVFVTYPDAAKAKDFAQTLVSEQLAACVNILPKVTSVYRWEGKVETGEECLLILKTVKNRVTQLESRVKELHPYEVPEFVAIDADKVEDTYLEWAINSTMG